MGVGVASLPPFNPLTFSLSNYLKSPHSLLFSISSISMKLVKNFSPKRLFGSKKDRSKVTRSDQPPSFASSSSSSSDAATPTSVLPQLCSGEWSDFSDMNSDMARDVKVSRKQLEALLGLFGADPPSEEEVAAMVGELDGDGDGIVSVEALMGHVGGACGESELRETFKIFDANHDGRITAEELLSVFDAIGEEQCTLEDCRRMIAGVDKNGDGFVCFKDFALMMDHQSQR